MADDIDKLRNLALGARDTLQDEAYEAGVETMEKVYLKQLIATDDMNKTLDLVSRLRVLHDVAKGLQLQINNHTVAMRKGIRRA
jgi:hypothetical protein